MVKKKSFTDELKKYNTELDKHLPNLDFDFLKSGNVFEGKDDFDDEVSSLVASNLIDLKTEIALIRKNLSNDIEGMVMRSLHEQQSQFSKFMDDFYKKMSINFKNTVSTFGEELGGEFSKMRLDFDKISLTGDNLSEKLNHFETEIVEFSSILEGFDNFKISTKVLIENQFKNFNDRLFKMEEHFEQKFKDNKSDFNKTLKDLSKQYVKSNKEMLKIQNNSQLNINNIGNNLKKIKKVELEGDFLDSNIKSSVLEDPEIISDEDFKFPSNSPVDRLLSIDSRLKKLDSLR